MSAATLRGRLERMEAMVRHQVLSVDDARAHAILSAKLAGMHERMNVPPMTANEAREAMIEIRRRLTEQLAELRATGALLDDGDQERAA